ncbi:MAG: 16S rRNA (guanine(966)-N(2))-methyltransferase RsmD [Nitrospinae bacterium RIFCSPLOWO2_01_FULL_39_10]|nr:MAG: 16S rRNA (guanine(966)-N(2))-methyltransferase RsmD [Nitrospinae bacterium RIFCSPLOWO2_01_FULL_39_10]
MRVISGTFKGRKLIPPKGLTIRPTPDKVKGAIFNILGDRIIESSFLDLFAGTGAIGIEALSRGAKEIIFVDDNIKAINLIKENLSRCKMQDARCKIVKENAVEFIKSVGQGFSPAKFDFIFLEPPYKSDLGEKALIEISSFNILKEDGEIIWEHYYKTPPLPPPLLKGGEGELQLKRTICYGDTALSFFSYH